MEDKQNIPDAELWLQSFLKYRANTYWFFAFRKWNMEGNHNYIFHALKSMSPSLEVDRIRREIETLSLQFLGLPSEVPKHDTVWDQRSMFCTAVVSPSCSKQSVSYENCHKTSSVLSASKTGYSIVHQYNKSFTPFHISNRVFFGCI